jgi:multicomponent Na+:H+ antiporter subunit E
MLKEKISYIINMTLYIPWLIREIFFSSLAVTRIIWSKKLNIDPHYINISILELTKKQALIYSSSITLTPGTITVKLEENNSSMDIKIHALDDNFAQDLKSGIMQQKIQKLFS